MVSAYVFNDSIKLIMTKKNKMVLLLLEICVIIKVYVEILFSVVRYKNLFFFALGLVSKP